MMRRASRLAIVVLLAGGILWVLTHRALLRPEWIGLAIRTLGPCAPIGFILIYAFGMVLFFPGAILSLLGGAVFGPVWPTAWNLGGATLGATIAFIMARTVAGAWVARRVGGRLRRLVEGVTAEGWRFVALMRLVPLIPFNLLNYALGLTGISLTAYVLTSAVCMLPGATAYTWLGYAGRSAAAGDGSALLWPAWPWRARGDRIRAAAVSAVPLWGRPFVNQRRRRRSSDVSPHCAGPIGFTASHASLPDSPR